MKWKRESAEQGYELGDCVCETPDWHLAVAGVLKQDAARVKLDVTNCAVRWVHSWPLGIEDAFEGIDIDRDENMIAVGYVNGLAEGAFLNWGQGVMRKIDRVTRFGRSIYQPI